MNILVVLVQAVYQITLVLHAKNKSSLVPYVQTNGRPSFDY